MKNFIQKNQLLILTISWLSLAEASGQTITPQSGRQAQFLWERHGIEFSGANLASSDSIFLENAHRLHAMTLAVSFCSAGFNIPVNDWPSSNADTILNLWSSRTSIKPGLCPVTLPTTLIPGSLEDCSWTMIHDGISTSIIPGEIFYLDIPENTQSTSIGIQMAWNGTEFERHILMPVVSSLDCPEPDLPPWPSTNPIDPWWIGAFNEGQAITGQALIKIGSDGVFNQPLIICEGFDPGIGSNYSEFGFGDMNWSVLWNCDGSATSGLPSFSGLLDSLLTEGLDLVYVDYADGTNSIQAQSTLLKEVIRLCREYKSESWPTILVGASMGGVIARWALREMELDQESHCVRLFVSIDSPFRGAWLPPALQHAIEFFAPLSFQAEQLFEALTSDAAGQLLIESPFHSPSIRDLIETQQSTMGPPEEAIIGAISNGNPEVSPAMISSILYSAQESFLGWDVVDINLFACPGNLDHPSSNGQDAVVLDAQLINTDWNWGEPIQFESIDLRDQNLPCYSSAPGSHSAFLQIFHDALEIAGISADSYQSQSIYIPCYSAFDLPSDEEMNVANMPIDYWSTEPLWNPFAQHCDLTNHLDALWNWIVLGRPLQNQPSDSASGSYEMGWSEPFQSTIGSFHLPANGTLHLGTTEANGPGVWPIFECATTPCNPEIWIGQNGNLILGDTVGMGRSHFSLTDGASLNLDSGSEIHIGPYSTLTLKENSILRLHNAVIHIHPQGRIDQQKNAKIEVSGTSTIIIDGEASKWLSSGDLIVSEGDTLLIEGGPTLGGGSWTWVDQTVYTYLGQNAFLGFNLQGSGVAMINTENGAGHLVTGAGTLKFFKTSFNLADSSHVIIETKLNASHSEIIGFGVADTLEIRNRCKWTDGHWEKVYVSLQSAGISGDFLKDNTIHQSFIHAKETGIRFEAIAFTNSEVALTLIDGHSVIKNCQFIGGIDDRPQLSVHQTSENLRLEFNNFSHHELGIQVEESSIACACNEWQQLNIGCMIGNDVLLDCSHPNGGNRWTDNGVHMLCNQSFVPLFGNGGNEMGPSDDATFMGTLQIEADIADSVFSISQNGNLWPNSIIGMANQVPYTALESTMGSEVVFLDAASNLRDCSASEPVHQDEDVSRKATPESARPVGWSVYPNPAHKAFTVLLPLNATGLPITLEIIDATGRRVYWEEIRTPNSRSFMVDVSDLKSGWHIIIIDQKDHPPFRQPLLISHS